MIGIVMGSKSDLDIMRHAAETLETLGLEYEMRVLSAHRCPEAVVEWTTSARGRGMKALICGAGLAAHLAGVVAAGTTLPVLGVPMPGKTLGSADSLYSMVQMPKGIPVATFAIGRSGAINAALFAAAIIAVHDADLATRLANHRESLKDAVLADDAKLQGALQGRSTDEPLAAVIEKAKA